jgi:hypothetical protein
MVVNLTVKFDNPGIQMQVNNEAKSKTDTSKETRKGVTGIATIAKFGWTQPSTHCLSEVDQHL